MMMGFPGIFEAALLIALGLGYVVLYLAKKGEKQLQFLGYVIGVVIIVLSLIYLIANILTQSMCYPPMRRYKGILKQRMMQQQEMPQPAPQAPAQKR